jgi:pyruvate/2-oxoglutarate dehydrogenase complex dihydrolipoamide dehydrogenase (E3) component
MTHVLVIGAGPAGVLTAFRAGDLGAQTALVTSGAFGSMAANDGPVSIRTLAHAGRLMREARQLGQFFAASADRCIWGNRPRAGRGRPLKEN